MPQLEVQQLEAGYGSVRILHDVSLHVDEAEIVSLIGPNGAGKTTLLRAISRLVRTTGRLAFGAHDLTALTPQQAVQAGVVQCADDRKLFPYMTVQDNLALGAYLRTDKVAIAADLDRVFGLFPVLAQRRQQRAGTLSGGEQQMVSIGRALMCSPQILLLDEPSFGIGPIVVDRIFEVIRQLNQDGLTVLMVEQDVSLALDISARAYVLENGRIVLQGASHEISQNEDVRKAYLGL